MARCFLALVALLALLGLTATDVTAQVTIAQLSDTHIGEQHSPHSVDNLRRAVDMINQDRKSVV